MTGTDTTRMNGKTTVGGARTEYYRKWQATERDGLPAGPTALYGAVTSSSKWPENSAGSFA